MQISNTRLYRAAFYLNNPEETSKIPKYALIDELKFFGLDIDPNRADLDLNTLRKIFDAVLDRIGCKYYREVNACR